MICAKCGHELTGYMKFCSHCGQKQAAGSVAPKASQIQRTPVAPKAAPIQRTPVAPQAAPIRRTPVAPQPVAGIVSVKRRKGRVEDHHFKTGTFLQTMIWGLFLGAFILFVMFGFGSSVVITWLKMGIGHGIFLLIVSLLMVGFFLLILVFGILLSYHDTTISGREIHVKKILWRRRYDCSEIKQITVANRYYHGRLRCYIRCDFTDGKHFEVDHRNDKITETAAYFLDLYENGLISDDVVSFSLEMLRKMEVRAW